ncbi:MAG: deoxyribodipyrimidine photo-lyase [Pseudomonadota bacterium]
MSSSIVWFRRNLRLTDNAALEAAIEDGHPLLMVYVLDELDAGAASRWWLHGSLASLAAGIERLGGRLILRRGDPVDILDELADRHAAASIHCARRYEAEAAEQERRLAARLGARAVLQLHEDSLLRRPVDVTTQTGSNYKVFTPYYKASIAQGQPAEPGPAPEELPAMVPDAATELLQDWRLLPAKPDWAAGFREVWTPGERGAEERIGEIADNIGAYGKGRDHPAEEATSRLSPHLHFGEISPRQVWHGVMSHAREHRREEAAEPFTRQLHWRDFSAYLLFHNPTLPEQPLRPEFRDFPWHDDAEALEAWQKGQTGYPIVDAGMRQLWHTGWMHNRVRMIVASLLVKHLLIPWQRGAEWFMDTLVDADAANNSAGWQWVAGCGSDAAPYFRIFNPITQGQKFDPQGEYVRQWVPELRELPARFVHEPWTADDFTLQTSAISLGETYPRPIIEHKAGREQALAAYRSMRERRG